jgi:phage-related protein
MESIFEWLTGASEIIFSNDHEYKREARIVQRIDLEQQIRSWGRGQVFFELQPFRYKVGHHKTTLSKSTQIHNPGSHSAEPIITVYGVGDVKITINGREFTLRGLEDGLPVVVDSRLVCAYRKVNGTMELMNFRMTGDFPYFDVGGNKVELTGEIQKIEIEPFWRWL